MSQHDIIIIAVGITLVWVCGGVIAIRFMQSRLGLRFADDGDFIFKFVIWPITLMIGLGLYMADKRDPLSKVDPNLAEEDDPEWQAWLRSKDDIFNPDYRGDDREQ